MSTVNNNKLTTVNAILSSDDYFVILGIDNRHATIEDIEKAYRIISRMTHPDKHAASETKGHQGLSQTDRSPQLAL
jgi:preprotein translocase subunit Sec63